MDTTLFTPLDGADLSGYWALPFIGIIFSIAIIPLAAPKFWAKHYGKVSLFWALAALIGIWVEAGYGTTLNSISQVMFGQFLPFIMLLLALFTITGGIMIEGSLAGTPKFNTLLLGIGGLLSSVLGTTGAAVLFIRPLLQANKQRTKKIHTIIFFIFIVANIGGSLTPIGNPPLLMGYISHVPFFWPTAHLLLPTLLATGILLIIFYFLDRHYYKKEAPTETNTTRTPIRIKGLVNIALLLVTVLIVIISSYDWETAFTLFGTPVNYSEVAELLILGLQTWLSHKFSPESIKKFNNFSWEPIVEVGKIFVCIFLAMSPLLAILRAGKDGALHSLIAQLTTAAGSPANDVYYWASGMLSAFLDSAPAYLVFFNIAAAPAAAAHLSPEAYMTAMDPTTLLAITMGASFMGALSYIGNAPNMMIKSIAEADGSKMPSFFGYMAWSFGILIPLFLLMQWLFL